MNLLNSMKTPGGKLFWSGFLIQTKFITITAIPNVVSSSIGRYFNLIRSIWTGWMSTVIHAWIVINQKLTCLHLPPNDNFCLPPCIPNLDQQLKKNNTIDNIILNNDYLMTCRKCGKFEFVYFHCNIYLYFFSVFKVCLHWSESDFIGLQQIQCNA